ncbi:MAG: SHOCT domain-containing protein [Gemmatimonadales bacterium]|nr:SHOCT domain-containing protein [Gemmatimonadales bacterium]
MDASTAPPSPGSPDSPALVALRSLLIPGETLQTWALQRRLFALVHRRTIVGATSGRLIAVHRGLFGGFTPQDVRWQDLDDARVSVGIFGATLTVSARDGNDLAGNGGPGKALVFPGLVKEQAQEIYRVSQAQEQAWREKRRVRELEEMRAKSGGINLAGGAAPTTGGGVGSPGGESQAPADRLQRAKTMLDQGLLTDAEFEQVKARILAEL